MFVYPNTSEEIMKERKKPYLCLVALVAMATTVFSCHAAGRYVGIPFLLMLFVDFAEFMFFA